ncbi:MAG: hypothetical protein WB816_17055 [Methylocystis sp.]
MNDANGVLELSERSVGSNLLPKTVLLRGEFPTRDAGAPQLAPGMYEFEVVTENAAYKKGERFYLTPSQAKRAYFSGQRAS